MVFICCVYKREGGKAEAEPTLHTDLKSVKNLEPYAKLSAYIQSN
jgi:hypothetical protein